jgi:glycosyltransferase involved in cell wall biosynthesis
MRVLVVNKFFWEKGGAERVMFDLARGYEAAGHEVVHFAMASSRNRPSAQSRWFVPEVDYEGEGGGPWRQLRTAARAIYSLDAARRLRDLVRRTRPAIAHLHNFHHQLSPSIVDVLRHERVPAIQTLHDYKVLCPNYLLYTEGEVCERCCRGRYYHAIVHRCVRNTRAASLVACVEMTLQRLARTLERGIRLYVSPSRFLARKLEHYGTPAPRIRVIPNGIDAQTVTPAAGAGEGFLYVGRLSREKGLTTLLAAFERTPRLRLTIVGTGPVEPEIRRRVQAGLRSRVELTGQLSRAEVARRIAAARAVVLPSEWYENAPISVLETLAAAVPVIGADIGGIPELVRDRETGLLFPAGDSAALAARLQRLESEPQLARRLGLAGRDLVEREYSFAGQLAAMLALLQEVAPSESR